MWEHVSTIVTVLSFVLSAGSMLVGMTRKLSKVEMSLRHEITGARHTIERDVGESLSAVRQKMHEIETWVRDEFVRKEGFYKVRDDLAADLDRLGDKIEKRLERMEAKIDARA